MNIRSITRGLAAAILAIAAGQAVAVDTAIVAPPIDDAPTTRAVLPEPPAMSQADAPGLGATLDGDALDAMRGGDDTNTTTNTVDVHGDVGGNTATDIITGTNSIDGGSFANSTGISTVIQNSGANVLIQNGMVVNVQFADPGL